MLYICTMNAQKIKIAILEDNDVLRESIKIALNLVNDFEVVMDMCTTGIQKMCENKSFDVLIMDISTSSDSKHCNVGLLQKIRRECPALKVIVLINHTESCYAAPIVKAGANAVMPISAGKREFEKQIRGVLPKHLETSVGISNV